MNKNIFMVLVLLLEVIALAFFLIKNRKVTFPLFLTEFVIGIVGFVASITLTKIGYLT